MTLRSIGRYAIRPCSAGDSYVRHLNSFMPQRTSLVVAACVCALAVTAFAQTQVASEPWAPESLQSAIQGCRASIADHATRDYLKRHQLQADQLPPDFRERILPVLEPFLRTCNCSIEILSREVSLETFRALGPEVQSRLKELVQPGGMCAAKRGA